MPSRRDVALARFQLEAEARMWAELFEENDIPVVVVPLGAGAALHGAPGVVPYELRVRNEDLERAREMLRDFE